MASHLMVATDMRHDNEHVMESFLASSPPPWNAGLESVSPRVLV